MWLHRRYGAIMYRAFYHSTCSNDDSWSLWKRFYVFIITKLTPNLQSGACRALLHYHSIVLQKLYRLQ